MRAIVGVVPGGAVRTTSRNDRDVTASYPELLVLVDRPVLLDGDLVALDERGRPSFERLQARMHVRQPSPALLCSTPC